MSIVHLAQGRFAQVEESTEQSDTPAASEETSEDIAQLVKDVSEQAPLLHNILLAIMIAALKMRVKLVDSIDAAFTLHVDLMKNHGASVDELNKLVTQPIVSAAEPGDYLWVLFKAYFAVGDTIQPKSPSTHIASVMQLLSLYKVSDKDIKSYCIAMADLAERCYKHPSLAAAMKAVEEAGKAKQADAFAKTNARIAKALDEQPEPEPKPKPKLSKKQAKKQARAKADAKAAAAATVTEAKAKVADAVAKAVAKADAKAAAKATKAPSVPKVKGKGKAAKKKS